MASVWDNELRRKFQDLHIGLPMLEQRLEGNLQPVERLLIMRARHLPAEQRGDG